MGMVKVNAKKWNGELKATLAAIDEIAGGQKESNEAAVRAAADQFVERYGKVVEEDPKQFFTTGINGVMKSRLVEQIHVLDLLAGDEIEVSTDVVAQLAIPAASYVTKSEIIVLVG